MLTALREIEELLGARADTAPSEESALDARRLQRHVREYLIPRADDLDAPVLAVILGSTGSGKSSLINALAGSSVSEVSVLRPTTRVAKALAAPGTRVPTAVQLLEAEGQLEVTYLEAGFDGLVLVDAPDVDSVESANRQLAGRLLEAADLLIFMTTDTRYADEVPWKILSRAGERGIPMLTVINRLPADPAERRSVLDDYTRMLTASELETVAGTGAMEVIGIGLGELSDDKSAVTGVGVQRVREVLDRLVADDEARKDMVRRGLDAAVSDLPRALDSIVSEMGSEIDNRRELIESMDAAFDKHEKDVAEAIDRGSFLRSEILREWQEFVGANRVARLVADGVGKVAATIRSVFSPGPPAPSREVREGALSDLGELIVAQLDAASAQTASAWSDRPFGSEAIASDPELWGASAAAPQSVDTALEEWASVISTEILELGERRRGLAKAASLGVNVVGTGAILAVFANTGGLTGAEAGIAAATAVINQTLLEAIFGEANVATFVSRARERLDSLVDAVFGGERQRYEEAIPIPAETETLSEELQSAARRLADG